MGYSGGDFAAVWVGGSERGGGRGGRTALAEVKQAEIERKEGGYFYVTTSRRRETETRRRCFPKQGKRD